MTVVRKLRSATAGVAIAGCTVLVLAQGVAQAQPSNGAPVGGPPGGIGSDTVCPNLGPATQLAGGTTMPPPRCVSY
jgi:hypothetical protein